MSVDSARLEQAVIFALRLHEGQVRKGGGGTVPYYVHLFSVAALVAEHGGDTDVVIAALLHDGPEDKGGEQTLNDIEKSFGQRVRNIVAGCSDTLVAPKPPWRERKEAHIAHLAQADSDVKLVVAADKLHNARATLLDLRVRGDAVWGVFRGGREGTLWYYRQMLRVLNGGIPDILTDEIARTVAAIEELA